MDLQYYYTLYPAYAIALLGWLFLAPRLGLEPEEEPAPFEKPGRELLFALAAIVVCLGIGQLYVNHLLIPTDNKLKFIGESINHLLIFAPFPLLLFIRKQDLATAWIPKQDIVKSILLGLGLAILSICTFLLLKGEISQLIPVLKNVYSYQSLPFLVQVFLEDFAIALCFVRFQATLGEKWSIIVVAALFALGHVPAMLSEGVGGAEILGLVMDAGLAVSVLVVFRKWRNILWFWMIHFAMDMMQFVE